MCFEVGCWVEKSIQGFVKNFSVEKPETLMEMLIFSFLVHCLNESEYFFTMS